MQKSQQEYRLIIKKKTNNYNIDFKVHSFLRTLQIEKKGVAQYGIKGNKKTSTRI